MESVQQGLLRVAAACNVFAADSEVALLHITGGTSLRHAVLDLISAAEQHPANDAPFFFLEGTSWADRCDELAEEYDTLRSRVVGDVTLPPFPPTEPDTADCTSFAALAQQMVAGFAVPVSSAVVVLAPAAAEDAEAWRGDLQTLVDSADPAVVRWVVVDPLEHSLEFGKAPRVEAVSAAPSDKETHQALNTAVAALTRGAATGVPAQVAGGAGPKVCPPPRPGEKVAAGMAPEREAIGAALADAGVPALYGDQQAMAQLRLKLSAGMLAIHEHRPDDAIGAFESAAKTFQEAGEFQEALLIRLNLAGLLVQEGKLKRAASVFEGSREEAISWGHTNLAAQAQLGRASLFLLAKDPTAAGKGFVHAAELATEANEPILAVEAYRTAGHAYADAREAHQAKTCWTQALELATGMPKEAQCVSSAPDAARALAEVYRRENAVAQAQSLEELALYLEAPLAGSEDGDLEAPPEPQPSFGAN